MKSTSVKLIALAAMISGFALPAAWADTGNMPEQTTVFSDALFAPPGFADTSNAQIVARGSLPSTCYKVFRPHVSIDRSDHRITVALQALRYSSPACLTVPVPFTQTIDLGLLPEGRYHVVETDASGKTLRIIPLTIGASISSAPDDFLYAPVEHLRMDHSRPGRAAILDGVFASDCMELREVRVLHPVAHVLELLPVAVGKAGESCQPSSKPFEVRVELPEVEAGETLIHVRTLSGISLNEVVPLWIPPFRP